MRISDILKTNKVTVSCEMFPPKPGKPLENTQQVVHEIAAYKPSFMSVTYGAGGSNSKNTLSIAEEVQKSGVTALAHLTCVGQDEENLRASINAFKASGIENILALRGDIPEGDTAPQTFPHASDLINAIRREGADFCIGGACYPEGHPESYNSDADIDGVRRKVESGCEFLTTQMFFDNSILYSYLYRIREKGITVPVIAGIMPVTNAKQISRITGMSGTYLPARFKAIVDRFGDNPAAMKQAGIAYATDQIIDLIANGVNGIHVYSMNKPDVAARIRENLSEIL